MESNYVAEVGHSDLFVMFLYEWILFFSLKLQIGAMTLWGGHPTNKTKKPSPPQKKRKKKQP